MDFYPTFRYTLERTTGECIICRWYNAPQAPYCSTAIHMNSYVGIYVDRWVLCTPLRPFWAYPLSQQRDGQLRKSAHFTKIEIQFLFRGNEGHKSGGSVRWVGDLHEGDDDEWISSTSAMLCPLPFPVLIHMRAFFGLICFRRVCSVHWLGGGSIGGTEASRKGTYALLPPATSATS